MGGLGHQKGENGGREIHKMFHRQNRVDVNAVAGATGAREKLVRKVVEKLIKEGELPGVNV